VAGGRPRRQRVLQRIAILVLGFLFPHCDVDVATFPGGFDIAVLASRRSSPISIYVSGVRLPEDQQPDWCEERELPGQASFEIPLTEFVLEADIDFISLPPVPNLMPCMWSVTVTITPPPLEGSGDPISCSADVGFGGNTMVTFDEASGRCVGPTNRVDVNFPHDVAVTLDAPDQTLQNRPIDFSIGLENQQAQTETVSVQLIGPLPSDEVLSTWEAVNLAELADITVPPPFRWTPTCTTPPGPGDLPAGSYTFRVNVAAVNGETDLLDNSDEVEVRVLANCDGDEVPDDIDNCDTVTNPLQEDCDGDQIGDACDTPEIRAFAPTCGPNAQTPGESIFVIGFGFATLNESNIRVGGQPVVAGNIIDKRACRLQFVSPVANLVTPGTLDLATSPPLQRPLCRSCPGAIALEAFHPADVNSDTTVTLIGCGFEGTATRVWFEDPTISPPNNRFRVAPVSITTASQELIRFSGLPTGVVVGKKYNLVVIRTTGEESKSAAQVTIH
jgi:hypothetical protein